jgi:hypothetical protein
MLTLVRLLAIDGLIARWYSSRSRQGARQPYQAAICPPRLKGCGLARERVYAAWLAERPSPLLARELRFDAIGVVVDAAGSALRLDHVEGAW